MSSIPNTPVSSEALASAGHPIRPEQGPEPGCGLTTPETRPWSLLGIELCSRIQSLEFVSRCGWCPCKQGELDQELGTEEGQLEGMGRRCLHAKEQGFRRNQSSRQLGSLGLLASRTVKHSQFRLFKPLPQPGMWDSVRAALRPRPHPESLIQWPGASRSWSCVKPVLG